MRAASPALGQAGQGRSGQCSLSVCLSVSSRRGAAGAGGPWPLDVAGAVRMALGPCPPPLRPGHGQRALLGPAPRRPARPEPHEALPFPTGTGGTPRSPKGDETFCGPGRARLGWRYGGLLGEGLCGVNFKDKRVSAEDTQEVRAGNLGSVFSWRCTEFVLRPVCRGQSAASAWLRWEYGPIGTGYCAHWDPLHGAPMPPEADAKHEVGGWPWEKLPS